MCDQANHDNCEILDELNLVITNLEMTIVDLKAEFLEDLNDIQNLCTVFTDSEEYVKEKIEKWEAK